MAETFHTNLVDITNVFIRKRKIDATKGFIRDRLTEHPYYPSLYSLCSVFDRLNIDNVAIKVEAKNIDSLLTPFIAYLDNQSSGRDFVTVTLVTESQIIYYAENGKRRKLNRSNFEKDWLGIVLLAEPDDESGQPGYLRSRKMEINESNRKRAAILGTFIVFSLALISFLSPLTHPQLLQSLVLLMIKIVGFVASVFLLIYEIDNSNTIVKSICSLGRKTNCEAVLSSKASKVFGVSWSELGFFYFSFSILLLLFPGIDSTIKSFVLAIFSICAAPYILFSIYYQWKIVKQWCPLCLTVQLVLIAELISSLINVSSNSLPTFRIDFVIPLLISLMLPIIVWYLIKPIIIRGKDAQLYKAAYKRFLYNPKTFQYLLHQQKSAPEGYQDIGITIGSPNAKNTIIKVCNPYCGPCAEAHPVLEEIVKTKKDFKLKIIFAATNESQDRRGMVARHLLAVSEKSPDKIIRALDDWYLSEKKDYNDFTELYPLNGEANEYKMEIEKMRKWCEKAQVSYTPTIYINGYRLPEIYNVNELKYIL